MTRVCVCFAVTVLFLLTAPGCSTPWNTAGSGSYHPVIQDIARYPGDRTRAEFYQDSMKFWEQAGLTELKVEDVLKWVYDLDTVLEAREKQIEVYNKWAQAQNAKNGYTSKEL